MNEQFKKRIQGSCRFSNYYKLEWFDPKIMSWRPLQKSFQTRAMADEAKSDGRKWRVFEVSETGRKIIE